MKARGAFFTESWAAVLTDEALQTLHMTIPHYYAQLHGAGKQEAPLGQPCPELGCEREGRRRSRRPFCYSFCLAAWEAGMRLSASLGSCS